MKPDAVAYTRFSYNSPKAVAVLHTYEYSSGPSKVPVEQCRLPSIVPVNWLDTDRREQPFVSDNMRSSAGCRYYAGISL